MMMRPFGSIRPLFVSSIRSRLNLSSTRTRFFSTPTINPSTENEKPTPKPEETKKPQSFPWKMSKKQNSDISNSIILAISKFFFFNGLKINTEEDFLNGAKAAFESTISCIFQHPDLLQYQKDLDQKFSGEASPASSASSSSTGESSTSSTSLQMAEAFHPVLKENIENRIKVFIDTQRNEWNSNNTSLVPLRKIVHQLLQINSVEIVKMKGRNKDITSREDLETIKNKHQLQIPIPLEISESKPVDLSVTDIYVDVACRELFYIKDIASGQIVQGSDQPITTFHRITIYGYFYPDIDRDGFVAYSDWKVKDIDGFLHAADELDDEGEDSGDEEEKGGGNKDRKKRKRMITIKIKAKPNNDTNKKTGDNLSPPSASP